MAGVIPYTHDDWKKTNGDRFRGLARHDMVWISETGGESKRQLNNI